MPRRVVAVTSTLSQDQMGEYVGPGEVRLAELREPKVAKSAGGVALNGATKASGDEFTEWGDFHGMPPRDDLVEIVHYHDGPDGSAKYNLKDW